MKWVSFLYFAESPIFTRVIRDSPQRFFIAEYKANRGLAEGQLAFFDCLSSLQQRRHGPRDESWRLQPNRMAKATKHGPEELLLRRNRLPVCSILHFVTKQSTRLLKIHRKSVTKIRQPRKKTKKNDNEMKNTDWWGCASKQTVSLPSNQIHSQTIFVPMNFRTFDST